MSKFVLVATHSSDQCPVANSKIRDIFLNTLKEAPNIARRLGVNVLTGPLISTEHRVFAVVEAQDVQKVRDFLVDTKIIQFNSVEIIQCISGEEAVKELERMRPIY